MLAINFIINFLNIKKMSKIDTPTIVAKMMTDFLSPAYKGCTFEEKAYLVTVKDVGLLWLLKAKSSGVRQLLFCYEPATGFVYFCPIRLPYKLVEEGTPVTTEAGKKGKVVIQDGEKVIIWE